MVTFLLVYLSLYISQYLSICLPINLYLFIYSSILLSIYLYLSTCLPVNHSIYLSNYLRIDIYFFPHVDIYRISPESLQPFYKTKYGISFRRLYLYYPIFSLLPTMQLSLFNSSFFTKLLRSDEEATYESIGLRCKLYESITYI